MDKSALRRFSGLIKVDMVYEDESGQLMAFFDSHEDSPLLKDDALRKLLRESAEGRDTPFLYWDAYQVCFSSFAYGGGVLYLGPMSSRKLDAGQRRDFYRIHSVLTDDVRPLIPFTFGQIRDIVLLAATLLNRSEVEMEEELYYASPESVLSVQEILKEQSKSLSQEEAARDEARYRHTYHEEQQIYLAIQEGRAKDAIRISEQLDSGTGDLSSSDLLHWRTLSIVAITLNSRAAITAGIPPVNAYELSGYYISKCNAATEPGALLYFRNRCIEDLCNQIQRSRSAEKNSGYTRKCKDYIQKHYREKIYIEDMAAPMGISAGYLARQFKKDTGLLIQEYINQVRVERAANLLIYSDYTLSAISEYVHFPTQSYFGKVFKQIKGMTPNAYRKQFRVNEFWQY